MIADVIPEPMAMARKARDRLRFGSPKLMLEPPQVVFTLSSSRRRRTRLKTWRPAVPIAPIGITSGSTMMSFAESRGRRPALRSSGRLEANVGVFGDPVSSLEIATTAAP